MKNRGETAVIYDVYKNVLQRAGWALPRPSLYLQLFFHNKKEFLLWKKNIVNTKKA
jgi:hypothetical protein